MIRVASILATLSLLAACSLLEEEPVLRQIWHVDDDVGTIPVSNLGATFERHFYTVRNRTLIAYNLTDGSRVWAQDIHQGCRAIVVSSGRVFCPSNALYAFDAETGEALWTLPSDTTLSQVEGTADASRVFAATKTRIVAADAATGEVLWQRGLSGEGWVDRWIRSLTLSEDVLLVALEGWYNANGFFSSAVIVALDPATGAERWRYEDGGPDTDRSITGLTVWNGLLLYTDPHGNEDALAQIPTSAEAVALDRDTREVRWRYEFEPGWLGTRRAPLVADGVAYFSDGGGNVYAADAATGAPRWQNDVQGGFYNYDLCGPYLIGNNGRMQVFDRSIGSHLDGLLQEDVMGQTAAAEGRIYVSTDRGVYAFDCTG